MQKVKWRAIFWRDQPANMLALRPAESAPASVTAVAALMLMMGLSSPAGLRRHGMFKCE